MIYIETLLYVVKGGKVLLIRKKRGLGAGLFNGVGARLSLARRRSKPPSERWSRRWGQSL